MKPLRVLLWKHFLVRKRRWCNTCMDFTFPLLVLGVYWIISCMSDEENPQNNDEQFETILGPTRVLYSPETNLTNQLMDEVGGKLNLSRRNRPPSNKKQKNGMFPFSQASSMTPYFKILNENDAVVLFKDMDNTLPIHFEYTIRMNKKFKTRSPGLTAEDLNKRTSPQLSFGWFYHQYLVPYDLSPKPYVNHKTLESHRGSIYAQFVRLQWAIDTSYLHMLTGTDVKQKFSMEEVAYRASNNASDALDPYDENFRDSQPASYCIIATFLSFIFLFIRLAREKSSGIQACYKHLMNVKDSTAGSEKTSAEKIQQETELTFVEQELMKMVGLSIDVICLSHFINVVPVILIYSLLGTSLLVASTSSMVTGSNVIYVFIVMLLYITTALGSAFPLAYIFKTRQRIATMALLMFLLGFVMLPVFSSLLPNMLDHLIGGLLTCRPLFWFWKVFRILEFGDEGVSFTTLTKGPPDLPCILSVYVYLILQIAVLTLLTWYLTRVRPGVYGQPLPCTFPFKKAYWSKDPPLETALPKEHVDDTVDKRYFEKPPKDAVVGIRILNVSKVFSKNAVLSNVNLDVYKGELTVLLGHNGAGKTTLMNIIIGLMSPTSGKVLVNGMDTRSQRKEIRSQLGVCPQHNLFFTDLTVLEHTMFFAMLRGAEFDAAQESSVALLTKLNLLNKIESNVEYLSGGMKRRLQLACALAGGSSVLMLDEPTSGLDVETRREMWDTLLTLRGNRTVVLTTHFMEEADALADRIAALHTGVLKCNATSMFLKRAIGSGYRLFFTTDGLPKEAAITAAVKKIIADVSVRDKSLHSITYNLPSASSSQFPALFSMLEERRAELGINTIGVGKSTLDDVFIKLCSDLSTQDFATEKAAAARPEPILQKRSGAALCFNQFLALIKRQYYFIRDKLAYFLAFQVLIPIMIVLLLVAGTNIVTEKSEDDDDDKVTAMNLDLYNNIPSRHVLVKADIQSAFPALRSLYKAVEFEYSSDDAATFRSDRRNKTYLLGIYLNSTEAKAMYCTAVRHSAPVAVNLLSNMLAERLTDGASAAKPRAITAWNHPLDDAALVQPATAESIQILSFLICLILQFNMINNIQLPCKEKMSGSRHIHIMCGTPIPLYWGVTLLVHLGSVLLFMILPFFVANLTLHNKNTTDQMDYLVFMTLILLMGSAAGCTFAYCISVATTEGTASNLMIINMFLFSFFTPFFTLILRVLAPKRLYYKLMRVIYFTIPAHTLAVNGLNSSFVAWHNAMCNLNKAKCPNITVEEFDAEKCCGGEPLSYFTLEKEAPGEGLMVVTCQFIVFTIILLLTEYGLIQKWWDQTLNSDLYKLSSRFQDPMVNAENKHVDELMGSKHNITESLVCQQIQKRYAALCSRSFYIVKGISFSVKKGECFGLLGVNGAGKSTTFKILNGEVVPSRGNVYSGGYYINQKLKYMQTLSYCPQFFGLDDFLTGRQNIELVLTLRGLLPDDVKKETTSWIEEIGLTEHAKKRVSTYSGGCMRRLAAVAALCQRADTALLDEPTAGVDTVARRRVHAAVLRIKRMHSIIVASHSMDEMEALCDRLCIMVGGELATLGTAGDLRKKFAAGYTVVFLLRSEYSTRKKKGKEVETKQPKTKKVETKQPKTKKSDSKQAKTKQSETKKVESEQAETSQAQTSQLETSKAETSQAETSQAETSQAETSKAEVSQADASALRAEFIKTMLEKFDCTLEDEHDTTLNFHINNLMPYSELFTIIEKLRKTYKQLIQDYSLTETTLEEVFLYFSKLQKRRGIAL